MELTYTKKEMARADALRRKLDPQRMFRSRRHWEVRRKGTIENLRLKAKKEAC